MLYVAAFQASGLSDELILRACAPRRVPPANLPPRERRRQARKAVRDLVKPLKSLGLEIPDRDRAARQAATYAVDKLAKAGDRLSDARKEVGVGLAKVGENTRAQRVRAARSERDARAVVDWIRAERDYLAALDIAVRAEHAAGVWTLPESWLPPASTHSEIARRIAELEELELEIIGPQLDVMAKLRP